MPTDPIKDRIEVGDFFEGCSFHPLLCLESNYEGGFLQGISLVDGSWQSCSINSCGVRKLTPREAITWRLRGPQDIGPKNVPLTDWEPEHRWWEHEGEDNYPFWDPKTNRGSWEDDNDDPKLDILHLTMRRDAAFHKMFHALSNLPPLSDEQREKLQQVLVKSKPK